MSATGKGSGMHLDNTPVRFARQCGGHNAKLGHEHVPEVRRLLRTAMSVSEIAGHFSVSTLTLRTFVKKRQICNLANRRDFNSLQKSIAHLERDEASK